MEILRERYHQKQREINSKILKLKIALKEHSKRFKEDENNWGYLGDLGHINSVLEELDVFSNSNKKEEKSD